jgi:hypothetical protein
MDCVQFGEIVHELDVPGTQGSELREIALTHAESCGSCAGLLTETESLDFALMKLASESERNVAPPRVEAALLQEFRRAKQASSRRRVLRQIAAIGVAAALFLALGLSLRHRTVPSPAQATDAQSAKNVPVADPNVESGQGLQATPGNSGATAEIANAAKGDEATEFAEDFTPLPYADDPAMQEGGAVVRVVMSRSALASFGVAVTDVGNSEQIPADLLVSADGTPEAIRLVSQNVN